MARVAGNGARHDRRSAGAGGPPHDAAGAINLGIAACRTGDAYATQVLADDPILYWRLDEPSGTTAADASGEGNHGTYLGGVTLGTAGAIDEDPSASAHFDGSNDRVTLAAPNPATLTGSFTVELPR